MGVVISYATNLPGTDVMAWRSGCLILLVCVYVLWFFVFLFNATELPGTAVEH